jgi:putative ABC transport system ATP-binding protein
VAGPSPSPPRLELRRLTRRLPSGERLLTVLDGVDLAVAPGESVAVLGPSGSGKSTLLALAAGLDRPTAGEVLLDGEPIHGLSEDRLALLRRRKIGFVFQSFQLLGNLTARENVLLPLEIAGARDAGRRADELLAEVGLAERGHHYPSQLSGGEQQRVALARAFASRPPLLLADEPTGNLDSATGRRVLEVLATLRAREGTTLVLVTHDPAVASFADRLVHLADGRIVREERRREAAVAATGGGGDAGAGADRAGPEATAAAAVPPAAGVSREDERLAAGAGAERMPAEAARHPAGLEPDAGATANVRAGGRG